MNDLEFVQDIYYRYNYALTASVKSEEVCSSEYLQMAAADLAGGDADVWSNFVKTHRIHILQKEVKQHFADKRDMQVVNSFILEHTSDPFIQFMKDSLKSISEHAT